MSEEKKSSVFETLNKINVNDHIEKKGDLNYLSWAWAWQKVKENYPEAFYTIYENDKGWNYFSDGKTCWVKTGVTINGLEHIEYLPIMDYRNYSIQLKDVNSTDVNKAIQRSLTKACARHGLGLYIYAGEDLPAPSAPKTFFHDPALEDSLRELGASPEKLARAKRKTVAELTDADYRWGIKILEDKKKKEEENELPL